MYAWQHECLAIPGVLDGTKNLVVTAPTSAGKSKVADTILARRLADHPTKKVLLILPYVALCAEAVDRLRHTLDLPTPRAICEAFGTRHSHTALGSTARVIVATPESAVAILAKAHVILGTVSGLLSTTIVDEAHMLFDPQRGHTLDLVLTTLKRADIHIVCMTALLPGRENVIRWLDAASYQTTFRPVPLTHHIVRADGVVMRYDSSNTWTSVGHQASVRSLVTDSPGPVLIFCATKREAESVATSLCDMPRHTSLDILLSRGVGYHHADVAPETRRAVETLARHRRLRVLCCTPTLAAGINLPFRRVVVLHAHVGKNTPLTSSGYHQMAGRAGRAGLDPAGDAYLCHDDSTSMSTLQDLVHGTIVDPCTSQLRLRDALLHGLVARTIRTGTDVETFLASTLTPHDATETRECLAELGRKGLAIWDTEAEEYLPTPLGRALGTTTIPMNQAMDLVETLILIRRCYVMTSDFQFAVLAATGMPVPARIDWPRIEGMLKTCGPDDTRAAEAMGMRYDLVVAKVFRHGTHDVPYAAVCAHAIDLMTLVRGSMSTIPYGLLDHALRILANARDIAKTLGWADVAASCETFRQRVHVQGTGEAIAFEGMPSMTPPMATRLCAHGIESMEDLAQAATSVLCRILGPSRRHLVDALQTDARVAVMRRGHETLDALVDDTTRLVKLQWSPRRDRLDRRVIMGVTLNEAPIDPGMVSGIISIEPPNDLKDLFGLADSLDIVVAPTQCPETWVPDVARALARMERRGLRIDPHAIRAQTGVWTRIHDDAHRMAARILPDIDLASPVSVAHAVYDVLCLGSSTTRSTKKTSLDALKPHPFVAAVHASRRAKDVLDGLAMLTAYADQDNLVHPVYTSHASGRISTETPNVQCLPKDVRCVVSAPNGHGIITADFRHIELRIIATLSGDLMLRHVLLRPEQDPFGDLAVQLGVTRTVAKSTMYAMMYGAQTEPAVTLRSTFCLRYPRAAAWIASIVTNATTTGIVTDMFGRSRDIARDRASTTAVNAVCQTTCAGILHRALAHLDAIFPETLVGCLHDEVLLQGPPAMCRSIKDALESLINGPIPFFVDCRWAPTWT